MTVLLLLRHAKAEWPEADGHDHERRLNARGREAAARIGRYLKAHDLGPDLVICSTARRTMETLELALEAAGCAPEIIYDRALYLAPPERMLEAVMAHARAHAAATGHAPSVILVVGHNPGTETLAASLAGAGDPALIGKMHRKYPTGGLAVLDCADGLDNLPAGAALRDYVVPRELA